MLTWEMLVRWVERTRVHANTGDTLCGRILPWLSGGQRRGDCHINRDLNLALCKCNSMQKHEMVEGETVEKRQRENLLQIGGPTAAFSPQTPARQRSMHLLSSRLLLLLWPAYFTFSDSASWKFEHPKAIYAWDGACVWIPCTFKNEQDQQLLDNFTLYLNPEYNEDIRDFNGTLLYKKIGSQEIFSHQNRVKKTGENCTLSINPVFVNDSGELGMRVTWKKNKQNKEEKEDKWIERLPLNVSKTPPPPRLLLSSRIQEFQLVTATCLLDFACFEYDIQFHWFLEELSLTFPSFKNSISLTTEKVSTESKLQFHPQWTYDKKNLICQVLHSSKVLSENKVELDVKHAPKEVTVVTQHAGLIREGDIVKLFCRYHSSNPDVTRYNWKHGDLWDEASTEELWVYKVAWNTPPITCKACNQWCSESPPIDLGVQYAPRDVKILQIKPSSEIRAGNQVLLHCDFSQSNPKDVHFIWKKNGSLLKEGKELIFSAISPEDAGNYSCSINNSIGQSTSETWKLRVLYAPRRLRVSFSPADSVMEGRKVALTCESDANPPVSHYRWFDWNNQDLQYYAQTLRLELLQIKHSGSYWCQASNWLGTGESPPSTLTVYYSPETLGRRAAIGIGSCLGIIILAIWGLKFHQHRKRAQSQQGLQETSSNQSFFVRNKKVRRAPLSESPHTLGCYNPVVEDSISYAALHFPETDAPRSGDPRTSDRQTPSPHNDDAVTYSVVQKHVGDYENVVPDLPEDEGIHYSELVRFGAAERAQAHEDVEYVALKH